MKKIHADIKIYGIVQGVGFRPFVHKCIGSLCGNVRNTSFGALLSLEGEAQEIERFVKELSDNPPPLAYIEKIECERKEELLGYTRFSIVESERGARRETLISPDVATCSDCLEELFSEGDRRYKYPFINCTNCGPRFTIIRDIPYDRKNTTMAQFPMCEACASEYEDIEDRRYHAQPDCCPTCGPSLSFIGEDGAEMAGDAIENALEYLRAGKIVAVKGIGGVHLACRCDDEEAVRSLRERKRRDEKPFAIMCRDIAEASRFAEISEDEEKYLTSHRRPIVLLSKRRKDAFLHLSENGYIGIMLPYAPLHHLLLSKDITSVVMTSANISDMPIVFKNEEARAKLSRVADAFLLNDREIQTRCDDSLMWVYRGREYFARRSRGYVPYPLSAGKELPPVLACGAEQKASFCISRGNHVFPSQHIGDLKNLETLDCYEEQIKHFENIFDIKPEALVCDMHPDYLSSQYAEERSKRENIPLVRVYHHHAHMASCMADNGYDGQCIGIIWDGTGYGEDGNIWGGEFLVGDYRGFSRRGTVLPIMLAGGDRATRETERISAALLDSSGLVCDEKYKAILSSGINCPTSSGMGRLFDGVSAMLGICTFASYEGQGAILLEAAAESGTEREYPFEIREESGIFVFDWRPMIREIEKERLFGVARGELAAAFMNTLVSVAAEMTEKISRGTGIKTVALSGGTFQNMYILARLDERLSKMGMNVLTHRRVSCNDEGISLGQLHIACNTIDTRR